MNSKLLKIIKFVGWLLLTGISTWWTATSVYVSGQQSTPLFIWIAVFFILATIAAFVGLQGVKNQLSDSSNPSIMKMIGFFLIWLLFWGFSFATNVHRNVISQYGFNNINAQLQSCKQYVDNQKSTTTTANEKVVREAKENVKAKIDSLQGLFERNMDNTRPNYVGFGSECTNILNQIENELNYFSKLYHSPATHVIYDDVNDSGDVGKGMDHNSRQSLIKKYSNERINSSLNKLQVAIESYYAGIKKSTDLLETLSKNISIFERSEEFLKANDSKDVEEIYLSYQKLKKDILDKMPEEYQKETNRKIQDEDGNHRYAIYPSDRMFVFSNVWSDWWNNELPKDINLTGQFWLSFLIDFATYLLV